MILKWLIRLVGGLFILAAVCIVGFFGFWIWALTGMVQGEEISPDGFQTRHFVYYQPVFAEQGFWLDTSIQDDFSSQLDALRVCSIRKPSTWHLSSDNVTSIRSIDRHGEILTNLLRTQGEDYEWLWIEWTKNHTPQAKRFWPIVQSMAFDRLYLTMPLVFEAAQQHQALPPDEFEIQLRKVIATELEAMIAEAKFLNDPKNESTWSTLLQKYDPSAEPISNHLDLSPEAYAPDDSIINDGLMDQGQAQ